MVSSMENHIRISSLRSDWDGHGRARVVLFLARKCSGLEDLLALSRKKDKRYEIVGALLTTPASQAIPALRRWKVPWSVNDIDEFYASRRAKVGDLGLRKKYDGDSLDLISPFEPTHIALYGYIYILTECVLKKFPGRILNLHDSDLTIRNGAGVPRYRGLHATRDTILAGEPNTYSSVHVVTEEVDAGPMIVRSQPYPVYNRLLPDDLKGCDHGSVKSCTYTQREWMMRDCWPILMDAALEYLAARPVCHKRPENRNAQVRSGHHGGHG